MRMTFPAATLLTVLTAAPASSACLYNGVYYDHGATLCFGGWYQECTVADYWSAIGMCHHTPNAMEPSVQISKLEQRLLIAMVADTARKPALSMPAED